MWNKFIDDVVAATVVILGMGNIVEGIVVTEGIVAVDVTSVIVGARVVKVEVVVAGMEIIAEENIDDDVVVGVENDTVVEKGETDVTGN